VYNEVQSHVPDAIVFGPLSRHFQGLFWSPPWRPAAVHADIHRGQKDSLAYNGDQEIYRQAGVRVIGSWLSRLGCSLELKRVIGEDNAL
jgi:hypothetical protein